MRRIFVVMVLLASAALLGNTIECKADSSPAVQPVVHPDIPAIICRLFSDTLRKEPADEIQSERYLLRQYNRTPVDTLEASNPDGRIALANLGLPTGGPEGADSMRFHKLVPLRRVGRGFFLQLPLIYSQLNTRAADYLTQAPEFGGRATLADGLGYRYWDGLCGHPDPKVKQALGPNFDCEPFKVVEALLPGNVWEENDRVGEDIGPAFRLMHSFGLAFDVSPPKNNPIATAWLADVIATDVMRGVILAEFEPNGDHGLCNTCTFHIFVIPTEGETPMGVFTVRSLLTQALNSLVPTQIPIIPGLNINFNRQPASGQPAPPMIEVIPPSGGATDPAAGGVSSPAPAPVAYPIQHY